jgi:hypothetical protein
VVKFSFSPTINESKGVAPYHQSQFQSKDKKSSLAILDACFVDTDKVDIGETNSNQCLSKFYFQDANGTIFEN